jgi:hypothetical protein
MEFNGLIEKVTDPYERKARLYPALLALFPLIAMMAMLYGPKFTAIKNVITIAASCGGIFLMANICRDMGKRLEPKLYEVWGGKPTTQLLRHRDKTIEEPTKLRYHIFLADKIKVPFPSPEQEMNDPTAADEIYQSAVRWLLNQTRDTKKFSLLFKENIAYGFYRNALGVKPIGLLISISSLAWVLFAQGIVTTAVKLSVNINVLATLPDNAVGSLIASAMMIIVWVFVFTKAGARSIAFIYAEMLLRACDELRK